MIDPEGFERLYAARADPFEVATTWYEQRKQAVLVASLARRRYDLVWDAASGTGHLALALVEQERAARLLATDASPTAVGLTTALLKEHPDADTATSALPAVPDAARGADLTVVAEVLYYLPDEDRALTLQALGRQRGEVATVHWRHHPHDARLSGAAVTAELDAALTASGWVRRVRHDDADFVLAVWTDGVDA